MVFPETFHGNFLLFVCRVRERGWELRSMMYKWNSSQISTFGCVFEVPEADIGKILVPQFK